jgi:hypothetical protein
MARKTRIVRAAALSEPPPRSSRQRGAARKILPMGGAHHHLPFPFPTPYKPSHPSLCLSAVFPYVRNDAQYATWINIFNRSNSPNNICVDFVQPSGFLVKSLNKSLNPFQCERLTEPNFMGAVYVWGSGYYDVHSNLEMRENAGKGIALDQTANNNYFTFFQLAVEDEGPGKARTTLIGLNYDSNNPTFLLYGFGYKPCSGGWAPRDEFEVQVPPSGLLCVRPYDKIQKSYPEANVSGHTAPFPTGSQTQYYTAAQFLEENQTNSISLLNYRPPRRPYSNPGGKYCAPELYYIYLLDVEDDGVNRADSIYVKHTRFGGGPGKGKVSLPIHFYDRSGQEVGGSSSGSLTVDLARDAGNPASFQVVSPSKILGKSFAGSIWIETPMDSHGMPYQYDTGIVYAVIRRQAPGKWTALNDASPVGGGPPWLIPLCNIVPYVTNKDKNWIYQLILFYPRANYDKAPPTPKDKPKPYGGPNVPPPSIGGGWVLLEFHDMMGTPKGWVTIEMKPNETQVHTVDSLISNLVKEPFEGSVTIEPIDIVTQLEVRSDNDLYHAFTGNWWT